uniref:Acetylserotonin O-methyltransferase-like n=1 Tax=Cynoglossus semilaevis TaxID=244447 RepID=A0A3P8V1I1_CYNSE
MVLRPVISKLSGKLVVLASASPRRLEILRNVGLRFEVVPSWFDETLDKSLFKAPYEYAVETAKHKALEVARRMPFKHLKTPDIVIGADTVVTVNGMILEKPVDKKDAYRMLSSLSGKEHSVFTGVAIVLCYEKDNDEVDYQLFHFYEETKVKFADLSEEMLWEYINSGEPMDKAGGYGIQALGGMLVEYVHGDFLNVVGFPLNHFCKQLNFIYNHDTSSLALENATADGGQSGNTPPTPPLSAPTGSPVKHKSSNCPAVNQTPGTYSDSPMSSPVPKVVRRVNESAVGESVFVESSSTDKGGSDVEIFGVAIPQITSRGQETEPETKDLQRVIELMDGFKASKALFTASTLCVFDLLHQRPHLDAAQVAEEVKASVKGTECLLEACVSLGLLNIKARASHKPVYENTALAERFLRSDAPYSLHAYIQHFNTTVWHLFSHLESAVREGTNQHEKAFGKKSKDLFQDSYYESREVKLRFMRAMHSIAKVSGKDIATAFDLSGYKTACDLGGCTGAVAYEFTKVHPAMSVTVFDLPAVVEMSELFRPETADNRVSFVAGDFFNDELPKADLYILMRILHDWSDEKVHVLLSKVASACRPGDAVLIAEAMLDHLTPYSALQSLNMLVQTEGEERTEYRAFECHEWLL